MKRTFLITSTLIAVSIGISGCFESASNTGYLSDYSKLQEVSGLAAVEGSTFYFADPNKVRYNGFILEPVIVQLQKDSKAAAAQKAGKIKEQDINDIINYFSSAIIDAINESGYKIAYKAGAGIAKIRVAITDLRKTNILAVVPTARITTGIGTGGAAIESEMVDSVTGKQIMACVESKPGSRIPFTGLNDWGGAQHAIDQWISRFRKQLKEMKNL